MLTLAIAPLLAATPVLAPPLDQPLHYLFSEVREDRGRTMRFEIRRTITFRKDENGLSADVETVAIDEAADRAGAMFTAMMRGMVGRHIVFRLDPSGRVTDVDDLDSQWETYLAGIGRLIGKGEANTPKAAVVAQIVAARRAAPRAQRIASLAEMLAPVIADATIQPSTTRAITLPGRAHDGSAVSLVGTESLTRAADGAVRIDRSAGGAIGGLATRLTQSRLVDPRTALVRESTERLDTETPAGSSTITRTVRRMP